MIEMFCIYYLMFWNVYPLFSNRFSKYLRSFTFSDMHHQTIVSSYKST